MPKISFHLPRGHTWALLLIKPLPCLTGGIEDDAAGVLAQEHQAPVISLGEDVDGVVDGLWTQTSHFDMSNLFVNSADWTIINQTILEKSDINNESCFVLFWYKPHPSLLIPVFHNELCQHLSYWCPPPDSCTAHHHCMVCCWPREGTETMTVNY